MKIDLNALPTDLVIDPDAMLAAIHGSTLWAMEERALTTFLKQISVLEATKPTIPQAGYLQDTYGKQPPEQAMTSDGKGLTTIQVRGVMMKTVPWMYRFFGITCTGCNEVMADLQAAMGDPETEGILFHVESPGGQVGGIEELGSAILAAGKGGKKPRGIRAFIEDQGASGAYWLASQTQEVMANKNAIVGSIGVFMAFLDSSEAAKQQGFEVKVVRSGSHKGMGIPGVPITEEQVEAMQRVIDGMADNFITAVSKGRGKTKAEIRALATGQVWISKEAKDLGLVDQVQDMNAALARFRPAKTTNDGGNAMADQNTAPDPKVLETVRADALKAERQRSADIKTAFPDDPEFALAQIEAGASVVEAKGAYAEVLQERLVTQGKELDILKKGKGKTETPAKPVRGVAALDDRGREEDAGGTFMEQAEALAGDKEISLTEAMRKIARRDPDLYAAHKEAEEAAPRRPRR